MVAAVDAVPSPRVVVALRARRPPRDDRRKRQPLNLGEVGRGLNHAVVATGAHGAIERDRHLLENEAGAGRLARRRTAG